MDKGWDGIEEFFSEKYLGICDARMLMRYKLSYKTYESWDWKRQENLEKAVDYFINIAHKYKSTLLSLKIRKGDRHFSSQEAIELEFRKNYERMDRLSRKYKMGGSFRKLYEIIAKTIE